MRNLPDAYLVVSLDSIPAAWGPEQLTETAAESFTVAGAAAAEQED